MPGFAGAETRRVRWPFVVLLGMAAVAALAADGLHLLWPLVVLFARAFLRGAHRERIW